MGEHSERPELGEFWYVVYHTAFSASTCTYLGRLRDSLHLRLSRLTS